MPTDKQPNRPNRTSLFRDLLKRLAMMWRHPPTSAEHAPANSDDDAIRFVIDAPLFKDGRSVTPVHPPFTLEGWALAREGVACVQVSIDDVPIGAANYGLRREDVRNAFPDYEAALESGFVMHIPSKGLRQGEHQLRVEVQDRKGNSGTTVVTLDLDLAEAEEGPGRLRHKMPHAEVMFALAILGRSGRAIRHRFLMRLKESAEMEAALRTIACLEAQVLPTWHLTLVAPAGTAPSAVAAARRDPLGDRVQVVTPGEVDALAQHFDPDVPGKTFFGLLSPGDELSCDAVLELALAAADGEGDIYYADERRTNPASGRVEAFFKPQWSPDLLLSTNYIGRLWCVDEDLLKDIGATFAQLMEGGEYDLLLRLTERAKTIRHVAKVLCQRAGSDLDEPAKEQSALRLALGRRDIEGSVQAGCLPGVYRVRRNHAADALVSIIIPTAGARGMIKTCIESIRRHSTYRPYEIICLDHISDGQAALKPWLRENADMVIAVEGPFNWSRFNNLAATKARGDFLLFLNDDIEVEQPDWIDGLVEPAQRAEVGAVGPLLVYPDRKIQHAGMFLSNPGVARHAFRFAAEDSPGYFGLAMTQRNVVAVTGACMMVRRQTFQALGGFDEAHPIVNNDLDYCLRAAEKSLRVVYTPHVKLVHHELVTRHALEDVYDKTGFLARWKQVFLLGDPYFHQNLSAEDDGFVPENEPLRAVVAGHPLADKASIRRILVVKLDHLGDLMTAFPAIGRLKAHFPAAAISLLAPPASVPIAHREPAIDQIIPFHFILGRSDIDPSPVEEADLQALRARLSPERFDLAIDLRKIGDTRHVLRYTDARLLAGFDHHNAFPWLDVALEWEADRPLVGKRSHVATDLMNLVAAVANACEDDRQMMAADPGPARRDAIAALGDQGRALFERPVVCLHPGAGNAMRQWPPHHFADLIALLLTRHAIHIAVIGTPEEAEIVDRILGQLGERERVWNLVGTLSLGQLASLLAASTLYVGNNSGPQHLAARLGTPTVGIHSGVISSEEWGPIGPSAVALRREMFCSPCYHTRIDACPRQLECLTRLPPGFVYETCRRLLEGGKELRSLT